MTTCAATGLAQSPAFTWEGQVEKNTVIYIHDKKVEAKPHIEGSHFYFVDPLPDARQQVRLQVKEGRGSVQITDQPRLENDFTLAISIQDLQDGPGFYSIALYWDSDRGGIQEPPKRRGKESRGLTWYGGVDGKIRVMVRGNSFSSEVVDGQPATDERAVFARPLPDRADLNIVLKRIKGRGAVELVERPSSRNGYQLIFQISDPVQGSDVYQVDVSW